MWDKHQIVEEPYDGKLSRTVLKPSRGSDAPAQVNYNRLLQCYVLIDLKVDKLTHQDLGQMQMYVNFFDRYVKMDFEKPTIGILLCQEKNDALVKLTLPENANIYATEYALYLPNKSLLQRKLKEWIDEFEDKGDDDYVL